MTVAFYSQLPFFHPTELGLGRIHRADLKLSLACPPQTATAASLKESLALTQQRASKRQLICPHKPTVGSQLLNRVVSQAVLVRTLQPCTPYDVSCYTSALPVTPPWKIEGRTCAEFMNDARRTRAAPVASRAESQDEIEKSTRITRISTPTARFMEVGVQVQLLL